MKALFKEYGKEIQKDANFRLSLNAKKHVYFLEKGAMILFAAENKESGIGRRTLISTVSSNEILFDIDKESSNPFDIFAYSEERVVLWEMKVSDFIEKIKGSKEHQQTFSPLLEHYLNRFNHFLSSSIEMTPKHFIASGELSMGKGETFSLKISEVPHEKERVVWLTPSEGAYKLLGHHEMQFSQENFPILPHLYFLSLDEATYRAKTTLEMI